MKMNERFVTFDRQDAVKINRALIEKRSQASTSVSAGSAQIIRAIKFTAGDINVAYKTAREQLLATK